MEVRVWGRVWVRVRVRVRVALATSATHEGRGGNVPGGGWYTSTPHTWLGLGWAYLVRGRVGHTWVIPG